MTRFVRKDRSRLMGACDWFLRTFRITQRFERYWTSMNFFGYRIIWYPTHIAGPISDGSLDQLPESWQRVIEHEKRHHDQQGRWTFPLWFFLYLLVPLPVHFAYFRWLFERDAYSVTLFHTPDHLRGLRIVSIVENLDRDYGHTWPMESMEVWFSERLKEIRSGAWSP